MKAKYTTEDGRLSVEFDCDSQSELFEELASFQEVFEDRECVGKFGDNVVRSGKTRWQVRKDKEENKYYEMVCVDESEPKLRYAKKQFGVHKKGGGLFPKNRGHWVKYNTDDKAEYDLLTGKKVERNTEEKE